MLGAAGAERPVRVGGSSTVYPISRAMAEEFTIDHPGTAATVGFSGTGGGFSKACAGELDVVDASRPVTGAELAECERSGIALIELPVAADAITVVVSSANRFVDCLSLAELRAIWRPGSTVRLWSDVRPAFPGAPIVLYGPGTDSGTFQFFTEAVVGEPGAGRMDYFPSEDDELLVRGVRASPEALGFFGYAYYARNRTDLRALAIDAGAGCVTPTPVSVAANAYAPLSRPLFIYVSAGAAAADPALTDFVEYYLAPANRRYIAGTGYVAFSEDVYAAVLQRFRARKTGTAFAGFRPGEDVLRAVRGDE